MCGGKTFRRSHTGVAAHGCAFECVVCCSRWGGFRKKKMILWDLAAEKRWRRGEEAHARGSSSRSSSFRRRKAPRPEVGLVKY